ncbi:glycosyl hydrolase family 61-domain-containing protein [Aspergillus germanicus]
MDAAASTKVYTVAPGTELSFQLAYGVTIKHSGPLQVYMSRAPKGDVTTYDRSGDWFMTRTMASFTIPSDVPAGQYVVRVEHIGLHRGMSGNAEFYFTCAHIEVTGEGAGLSSEVVRTFGVYSPDDANIYFNIYYPTPTAYDLPCPAVWVERMVGGDDDALALALEPNPVQSTSPPSASAAEGPVESRIAPARTTLSTVCRPTSTTDTTAAVSTAIFPASSNVISK